MTQAHQLAAIMFTDIVGYTALMGEDEQLAFSLLEKSRQIQRPLIEAYKGQWLKEMGDGVLASFPSASDAVYCARAIRQACHSEPRLRLRIGIHLGDVVFEGGDVFGDGVNIAARLQALAPIGGIWISEPVQQNIANKKDIRTGFVKTETLKHVKEPVRIYRVEPEEPPVGAAHNSPAAAKAGRRKRALLLALGVLVLLVGGYFLYSRWQMKAPATGKEPSIAVLYFDNMSGDPEQEYFSDGITEEIITRLARIKGLKVISRTSALAYKNKPLSLKQIAGELKVSSVLEGSVRRSANSVRVTAQLIDAQTDRHIWAESYDRELHDIFAIQSEIANSIARKFAVAVSEETSARISRQPTDNIEAYDNYQKGRYFLYKKYLNTGKEQDWQKSKKFFEEAIRIDDGYAEAYAGLAEMYDALANFSQAPLPDSIFRLKMALARKAVQLDPQSSFAYAAMVWAVLNQNRPVWDYDSGYYYAKRAFLIDPSDPINLYNLSFVCSIGFGLHNEAVSLTRKAIQTDPMDPLLHATLGQYYMFLGNYPEARKAFQGSLDLSSEQFFMEPASIFWLAYMGDYSEADKRLPQRGASYDYVRSFVAALRKEPGKIKPAHRDNLLILLATNRHRALPTLLGRLEGELDKDFNGGVFSFDFLSTSYFFDVYRADPRFQRLLARAKKIHERNLQKYGNIRIPD